MSTLYWKIDCIYLPLVSRSWQAWIGAVVCRPLIVVTVITRSEVEARDCVPTPDNSGLGWLIRKVIVRTIRRRICTTTPTTSATPDATSRTLCILCSRSISITSGSPGTGCKGLITVRTTNKRKKYILMIRILGPAMVPKVIWECNAYSKGHKGNELRYFPKRMDILNVKDNNSRLVPVGNKKKWPS